MWKKERPETAQFWREKDKGIRGKERRQKGKKKNPLLGIKTCISIIIKNIGKQ